MASPAVGEVDETVIDVAFLVPMRAQPCEPLLVYERLQPVLVVSPNICAYEEHVEHQLSFMGP